MVVALLVLIVLTLLFGAAAVKGWLKNVVALALGLGAIILMVIWVSTSLGENGIYYVLGALLIPVIMLIGLDLWLRSQSPATEAALKSRIFEPSTPAGIDRVWAAHADEISRLAPEASVGALQLYQAGKVRELDRYCRRVLREANSRSGPAARNGRCRTSPPGSSPDHLGR